MKKFENQRPHRERPALNKTKIEEYSSCETIPLMTPKNWPSIK
jgi:hypothetical protein